MDILFSDLKKKDVYDAATGKKLGRIADLKFSFPAGKMLSVTVGGGLFGLGETKTMPFADVEKNRGGRGFYKNRKEGRKTRAVPARKKESHRGSLSAQTTVSPSAAVRVGYLSAQTAVSPGAAVRTAAGRRQLLASAYEQR